MLELPLLENELQQKLINLINTGYLLAIKAEFEAEGTRIDELVILSEICCKNNVPLTLKIGGPSAQRDFYEAFQIGANNILIPMVESRFALRNAIDIYRSMINLFKDLGNIPILSFNIESSLAVKNIDSIFQFIKEDRSPISEIVIGRTDLSSSMGLADVNSEKIFKISESLLKRTNIKVNVGGNLSRSSYKFIDSLTNVGLYSFESRKCTFKCSKSLSNESFANLIAKGLEFEISWLNYKKKLYQDRSGSENYRIDSIKNRLLKG
tara:strand:- start:8861 stop:9658 length:798 start_codon:yes stop_codon:yes gene_type:complete